ncbi:MAG: FAD-dependent oxidoreductase, partial [Acetobacteraceae bacterium]
MHAHCDVLVVGSGAAGLAAARVAGAAGARVIVCEQDFLLGGGLLAERRYELWREQSVAALAAIPEVTVLPRTTVFGYYDNNVLGAVERVADHVAEPPPHTPRQRYWTIRAGMVVLATGAHERFIAFPGNDRPGVMLAGAARTYATRYGVRSGRRALLFTNNDCAFDSLFALQEAGLEIAGVVDARADSAGAAAARERGITVWAGCAVTGTVGRFGVRFVRVRDDRGAETAVAADLLCVSGGINPAVHLASQSGTPLAWDDRLATFLPGPPVQAQYSAGAAAGVTGIPAAAADGARAGAEAAGATGFAAAAVALDLPDGETADASVQPVWEVKGRGKAFVDIQDDV